MFRVLSVEDYDMVSSATAELIASQVRLKPNSVLGLATGSSPIGTYQELIRMYQAGTLDFRQVQTVNLDEYIGLKAEDPNSYHYFMKTRLFDHINIDPSRCHLPDGSGKDLEKACRQYDEQIRALGGIDLQLLGIGHNGHIVFNEPSSELALTTHLVHLSENTIQANSRLFDSPDQVPRKALTMGFKNILDARRIVLIASGADKAEILEKALWGPVTPEVPASLLRLHNYVTVIADKEALPNRVYGRTA